MSEIIDVFKITIWQLQICADHAIANMNDLPMFIYNLCHVVHQLYTIIGMMKTLTQMCIHFNLASIWLNIILGDNSQKFDTINPENCFSSKIDIQLLLF